MTTTIPTTATATQSAPSWPALLRRHLETLTGANPIALGALDGVLVELTEELAHTAHERDEALELAAKLRTDLADPLPASVVPIAQGLDLDQVRTHLAQARHLSGTDLESDRSERNHWDLERDLRALLPLAEAVSAYAGTEVSR